MQVGVWKKIADLGSGAFGVVSLWENANSEDYVAIKMCKFKTDSSLTSRQKERWNNEVDILKIIKHPNIIKYKSIPQDLEMFLMKNSATSMPLLSMEYCRKGNLRRVLQKPHNLAGLPEEEIRYILEDISSGLQHLHNLKITHRDVKPDNIVLQHCDEREIKTMYKIIDLGYAKELGDSTVSFVGTLHYLAPEIFEAKNYNNSVDYWSMGILSFEIICGILPFLANLTPFERFVKIKQKQPDDICIYTSYSGQITYSSYIKKENFISTCLKQNLEIWLRHVLMYDQDVRVQTFPNNVKPFDYLGNILKKKIVNVFSVYKLEFYSYEVTEGTLVGTIKDWISRDIKVPKTELLLFISRDSLTVQDTDQVLNVVRKDYLYVTRKYFLPEKGSYNFPKLIREVMKSAAKFNMAYLKPLKSQFVFFITQEKHLSQHFKTSFNLYLNFLNHILNKVKNIQTLASSKITHLVTKIECYNKMKTDTGNLDLRNNKEYEECINYAQRLLASIERSINSFVELEKEIKCVGKRLKILSNLTSEILDIVNDYNLEEHYMQSITLVEKMEATNPKQFISSVTKSISDGIKIKESVLRNKKLKAFSDAIGKIMCHCFDLLNWIDNYNIHNEELLEFFEQNKVRHFDILLKAAQRPKGEPKEGISDKMSSSDSLNRELLSLPLPYLIQQNRDLRYNFEDALSSGISSHKSSTDYIDYLRL